MVNPEIIHEIINKLTEKPFNNIFSVDSDISSEIQLLKNIRSYAIITENLGKGMIKLEECRRKVGLDNIKFDREDFFVDKGGIKYHIIHIHDNQVYHARRVYWCCIDEEIDVDVFRYCILPFMYGVIRKYVDTF